MSCCARTCTIDGFEGISRGQKETITSGTGSVHGSSHWVWGYDPVTEWDKDPSVPETYAA